MKHLPTEDIIRVFVNLCKLKFSNLFSLTPHICNAILAFLTSSLVIVANSLAVTGPQMKRTNNYHVQVGIIYLPESIKLYAFCVLAKRFISA
jgi:hypothetical protein